MKRPEMANQIAFYNFLPFLGGLGARELQ